MPFENAGPLSSFVQALLIVLVPAALTATFGRMVGSRRQGWALYAAMLALFVVAVIAMYSAERHEHAGDGRRGAARRQPRG